MCELCNNIAVFALLWPWSRLELLCSVPEKHLLQSCIFTADEGRGR